ncbi:MAG: nucleotide sugar dehydrogenase [Flavobacteriaceae bacterium]|nr:nucleotide sugar dehydrogenase [Flavobacteriaceae bacterium]
MKVGVIGLGYVGLTLSIASALRGIKIYGIENNSATLESIQGGKAHFYEPFIDELLQLCIDRNFFVSKTFEKGQDLDAFIITIGTPLIGDDKKVNYQFLLSSLDALAACYTGKEVVILRSTISVGTTRKIVLPYLSKISGLPESKIKVAFCPERTIEGKAIEELYSLPQVIGANNSESFEMASLFFKTLTDSIIQVPSLEMAELVKLFNNTYRDVHFAMGNAFNEIAQSFGIDGYSAIEAANKGYKRSNIGLPGYVGGPCLEKDPYILSENMPNHNGKNFIINSRKYNESLEDSTLNWVKSNYSPKAIIGISGLAFKGIPETSDLRGSVAVNIARKIVLAGFKVALHDFTAKNEELADLNLGEVSTDFFELVEKAETVLIMNNSKRYLNIDKSKLEKVIGSAKYTIFDSWNILPQEIKNIEALDIKTLGNYKILEHDE